MNKPPRRQFLKRLGTATAALAFASPQMAIGAPGAAASHTNSATAVVPLTNWFFATDADGVGESQAWFHPQANPAGASAVSVPHTWQVAAATANYMGVAWYWTEFDVPSDWSGRWVRIEFEAVFHSARVWLNGELLGEHAGKGYTAFQFDVSPVLRSNGRNFLAVRVDNSFRPDILPRNRSYDWAPDGGITRPVNLLVGPPVFMERVRIQAIPDLDTGNTTLRVTAVVRNANAQPQPLTLAYRVMEEGSAVVMAHAEATGEIRLEPPSRQEVALPTLQLPLKLWHFDHPHLYRMVVEIRQGRETVHTCSETFGARLFEARGTAFYLNGERVELMGVERMAGSHPRYGMAEPAAWIEHDHNDLKELNCTFTRVHWQQDRRVLDYCDRHGILFQEEVPCWGSATFDGMSGEPSAALMQNGLDQLREMIERDGNHPCIVAWGLCNEVEGHNPVSRAFIQKMAAEARRLDAHRLLTYASNSLRQNIGADAAGLLDIIETNEYYGTWYPGNADSERRNLAEIHQAFPGKPVVISEYGYCECALGRLGGDAQRIAVITDHTQAAGEFDFVAGTIFFDYNDYRTQMGDKGVAPLQQRVHGVVDLYGNHKASFEVLRRQASPVEKLELVAEAGALNATLNTRNALPAYTLEGYSLRWIVFGFDDLPMEEGSAPLPKLQPGQQATVPIAYQEKHPTRVRVDVVRPTGFTTLTAWWKT